MTSAAPHVRIVSRHPWRSVDIGASRLHFAGDAGRARTLAGELIAARTDEDIAAALLRAPFLFALILESADGVLAAADRVRSTPVFHARDASGAPVVGNDARAIVEEIPLPDPDGEALLEIEMAGFVTGDATVYRNLRQVPPGAFVRFPASGAPPILNRYFRYLPGNVPTAGDPVSRLGTVLKTIFSELVARLDGRQVLVPISGGLDSCLVLAMLKAHGCRALSSFSYGMPGNTDATAGRAVAERLDVPWRFVASRPAAHRAFFRGPAAREFWRFADGLSCVPSPQDIVPLVEMAADGTIGPDTVIVNGQTGDFLSGGHIPRALDVPLVSRDVLRGAILDKHYALWRSLLTPANKARMGTRIESAIGLPIMEAMPRAEAIARYELWEFEGRQARWVVNAQRTYEFLGVGWELPLWHPALVEFFRNLPIADKIGQRCYRAFLHQWNHAGLFANFTRARSSWPRSRRAFALLERAALLLGGKTFQARANGVLRYFGHYAHQNYELDFLRFLAVRDDMRHIGAHHASEWLIENGFGSARSCA